MLSMMVLILQVYRNVTLGQEIDDRFLFVTACLLLGCQFAITLLGCSTLLSVRRVSNDPKSEMSYTLVPCSSISILPDRFPPVLFNDIGNGLNEEREEFGTYLTEIMEPSYRRATSKEIQNIILNRCVKKFHLLLIFYLDDSLF